MKPKRQRRIEALARRQEDLAQYESGNFANSSRRDELSIVRAKQDIKNLEAKIGY